MQFIKSRLAIAGVAAVAGLGMLAGGDALAQSRQALRFSNAAAPADWHIRGMDVFKAELEKTVPGRFDVQIYPSASLFRQGTELAALQRGNLELVLVNYQDLSPDTPELSIFTVPYVIRDVVHMRKLGEGKIGEWMRTKVAAASGVQLLAPFYLGVRHVGLREVKNVRTPADLKGLKIRMPPAKEWLFLAEALGGSPTPLGIQELYLALKTGTVDAQDNAFGTLRTVKLEEVLKEISLTGHVVFPLFLGVSHKVWSALTPNEQARIRDAAAVGAKFNDDNRIKEEDESVAYFRSKGLVITNPDKAAFREFAQKKYRESEFAKAWVPGMMEEIAAVK